MNWLDALSQDLSYRGFSVVPGVLGRPLLERLRTAMYRTQKAILQEIGAERLARAGEVGVLRNMVKFDDVFLELLALPELLAVVDATVSATAIMHLQNGFILPAESPGSQPRVFQNQFHRDFPRFLNGYRASINALFAVDEFTADNGATRVVPGSHQREDAPRPEYMEAAAIPVTCPAGSMVVFDSTLWHSAGPNTSGADRLAINHQFSRSFIKQQIDYVRSLGSDVVAALPARTQQLLGFHTRVVTSLDEYYQPEDQRLYRKGQG